MTKAKPASTDLSKKSPTRTVTFASSQFYPADSETTPGELIADYYLVYLDLFMFLRSCSRFPFLVADRISIRDKLRATASSSDTGKFF